jgi:hypothetical protein
MAEVPSGTIEILAVPNPCKDRVKIVLPQVQSDDISVFCEDVNGRRIPVRIDFISELGSEGTLISLSFSGNESDLFGIYYLVILKDSRYLSTVKLISIH